MTLRIAVVAVVVLWVAGCDKAGSFEPTDSDQCMRAKLFKECLAALPAGPAKTHYSDWDDVVDSCESAAYYQSLRGRTHIKPECRP